MAAIVFSQPSLANDWIQYQLEQHQFGGDVIAGVSRNQYHMEVFWVGVLASLWHKHFDSSWDREVEQIFAPREFYLTRLAAVSRASNIMEIFWIKGNDGSVEHAWWYDGHDWSWGQLAPPGSASQTRQFFF